MKRHFSVNDKSACGRGKVITDVAHHVDCLLCKARPEYEARMFEIKQAKDAAFAAQVPHTVHVPWTGTNLTCSRCGGDQFKDLDRDLWTFWFYCVACTKNQGFPTETGMCQ